MTGSTWLLPFWARYDIFLKIVSTSKDKENFSHTIFQHCISPETDLHQCLQRIAQNYQLKKWSEIATPNRGTGFIAFLTHKNFEILKMEFFFAKKEDSAHAGFFLVIISFGFEKLLR